MAGLHCAGPGSGSVVGLLGTLDCKQIFRLNGFRMRKFFNNLSIRSKLILLISGSVCALTASVLAVVWMQSLHQVRAIVQEQLDTNRQLFASAQRSHYQAHVYKGTTLASLPAVVGALQRDDRAAACTALAD